MIAMVVIILWALVLSGCTIGLFIHALGNRLPVVIILLGGAWGHIFTACCSNSSP